MTQTKKVIDKFVVNLQLLGTVGYENETPIEEHSLTQLCKHIHKSCPNGWHVYIGVGSPHAELGGVYNEEFELEIQNEVWSEVLDQAEQLEKMYWPTIQNVEGTTTLNDKFMEVWTLYYTVKDFDPKEKPKRNKLVGSHSHVYRRDLPEDLAQEAKLLKEIHHVCRLIKYKETGSIYGLLTYRHEMVGDPFDIRVHDFYAGLYIANIIFEYMGTVIYLLYDIKEETEKLFFPFGDKKIPVLDGNGRFTFEFERAIHSYHIAQNK